MFFQLLHGGFISLIASTNAPSILRQLCTQPIQFLYLQVEVSTLLYQVRLQFGDVCLQLVQPAGFPPCPQCRSRGVDTQMLSLPSTSLGGACPVLPSYRLQSPTESQPSGSSPYRVSLPLQLSSSRQSPLPQKHQTQQLHHSPQSQHQPCPHHSAVR